MDNRKDMDSDCKEIFEDEESIDEPNVIDHDRQAVKKDANNRKRREIARLTRTMR